MPRPARTGDAARFELDGPVKAYEQHHSNNVQRSDAGYNELQGVGTAPESSTAALLIGRGGLLSNCRGLGLA